MASFKAALHDGSDPLYASGLMFNGPRAHWKCPPKYKTAGYRISTINLNLPGTRDDEHALARALLCREHTRDMMAWYDGIDTPRIPLGTWQWLFARYRHDEFSPIRDVKANTKSSYVWLMDRWLVVIGHMKIDALDYVKIKKLERGMRDNGRTDSYIHRMFTMLRTVAAYGKALKLIEARAVSEILSEIRFRSAPARSVAPTRDQIMAVVNEADARGMHAFALGIMLQYELTLRAVDVRGQWFPATGTGGIMRNGTRWQDGLTWDMVEPDLSAFTKVISKTIRSMPEPMRFDLTNLPDIQTRLRMIGNRGRIGPVITSPKDNLPYTIHGWSHAFRRLRDAAGVPAHITMMDTRAGALTEAGGLGVDLLAMRDAAGHANAATTNRYARGRSASIANVIKIRGERT